jgi:hypothetical protein
VRSGCQIWILEKPVALRRLTVRRIINASRQKDMENRAT